MRRSLCETAIYLIRAACTYTPRQNRVVPLGIPDIRPRRHDQGVGQNPDCPIRVYILRLYGVRKDRSIVEAQRRVILRSANLAPYFQTYRWTTARRGDDDLLLELSNHPYLFTPKVGVFGRRAAYDTRRATKETGRGII